MFIQTQEMCFTQISALNSSILPMIGIVVDFKIAYYLLLWSSYLKSPVPHPPVIKNHECSLRLWQMNFMFCVSVLVPFCQKIKHKIIQTSYTYQPLLFLGKWFSWEILGSVRLSVCQFVWGSDSELSCLNHLTLDFDFLYEGGSWPWLGWDRR